MNVFKKSVLLVACLMASVPQASAVFTKTGFIDTCIFGSLALGCASSFFIKPFSWEHVFITTTLSGFSGAVCAYLCIWCNPKEFRRSVPEAPMSQQVPEKPAQQVVTPEPEREYTREEIQAFLTGFGGLQRLNQKQPNQTVTQELPKNIRPMNVVSAQEVAAYQASLPSVSGCSNPVCPPPQHENGRMSRVTRGNERNATEAVSLANKQIVPVYQARL